MNREILFKAKAINRDESYYRTNYKNGDWVYGLITRLYDERFENLPAEMTNENGVGRIEIDHNTICSHIGLPDKNKTKIFENDIVRDVDEGMTMVVRWDEERLKFVLDDYSSDGVLMDTYGFRDFLNRDLEIIGNVFDNPELIGK